MLVENKDNFKYKGKIELLVKYKDGHEKLYKKYNHGTPFLSKLFAMMMCGYSVTQYRPSYLDIQCTQTADSTQYISRLKSGILLTASNYQIDTDSYYYSQFNGVISYNSLNSNTNDFNVKFILKTITQEEIAIVETDSKLSELLPDLSTIVTIHWKLKLIDEPTQDIVE